MGAQGLAPLRSRSVPQGWDVFLTVRYRDEVVATNGENNTYHAGAYLGDGLHEGAIASAFRVAQLIGSSLESSSLTQNKELNFY